MNKKYKVGIVGATGMVGQRFRPACWRIIPGLRWCAWQPLHALLVSLTKRRLAADGAWINPFPPTWQTCRCMTPRQILEKITSMVDFVFCAVDMKKDEIRALEEQYAKHECPVVSNNSANRFTPDVPMVVPELNPQHIDIIPAQRKRLGTKRGFIAVKSNCSLAELCSRPFSLHQKYGIKRVLVPPTRPSVVQGRPF